MSSKSTRTSDPKGSKIFSNAISDPKPEAKDAIMTAGQKLLEQGRGAVLLQKMKPIVRVLAAEDRAP